MLVLPEGFRTEAIKFCIKIVVPSVKVKFVVQNILSHKLLKWQLFKVEKSVPIFQIFSAHVFLIIFLDI